LVYGDSTLTIVNRGNGSYQTIDLPFSLSRLELADNDFIITGYWDSTDYSETSLGLTLLSIKNDTAFLGETSWLENAYESESRSHAYSYKKQNNGDRIFALPVVSDLDTRYWKESAALNFFRIEDETITTLSPVLPQAFTNSDDECSVSCIDWYGNTRGIFVDDAIYALLGDQLTSISSESGDIAPLRHLNINSGEVLIE
jgi:hypothetical protein